MLKTLWNTFKWVLLLTVVLAAAVGGYAVYLWRHSDEILHTAFMDALKNWAPDAQVELGRVRIDLLGHAHLEDFSLKLPGDAEPLIKLPELAVDIDRDAFLERQEVLLRNVSIQRPTLSLTRDVEGVWNFQKLPPLPAGGNKPALPICLIEQAQVHVKFARSEGAESGASIDNLHVKLTPTSKRGLEVTAAMDIARIGHVTASGKGNVDARTGALTGQLVELRADRELVTYLAEFVPQVTQSIAQVEERLRAEFLAEPDKLTGSPFSIRGIARQSEPQPQQAHVADTGSVKPQLTPTAAMNVPNAVAHQIPIEQLGKPQAVLGIELLLKIGFQVELPSSDVAPLCKVTCDILDGELSNTALAFPLKNVQGHVEVGDGAIKIERLTCTNGPTEVSARGEILQTEDGSRGRVGLRIKNLACDERLRSRLSYGFGKIYDAHHPQGFLDMDAIVATNDAGQWKPESFTVTANRCSVMHDVFPYPVQDAVGTISNEGTDLLINMKGYAGRQPITLKGRVKNPGPNAWITFDIAVANLPIDETFIRACPKPLRKTVETMGLKGLVDGQWHLEKQPGPGQPFVPTLYGELHDASMVYAPFPYRVDDLSGKLQFDGKTWTFIDLKGVHGGARLQAGGFYTKRADTGELQLKVVTQDAPIDTSLFNAVPQNLKLLWAEFQPAGTIKRVVTDVRWIENRQPVISLPEIEITKGRCLIKRFPYEFTDIEAAYEYVPAIPQRSPAELKIKSFEARHDSALFVIKPDSGWITTQENGDWTMRFQDWSVRDLKCDNDLRRAVPGGVKNVISAFDAGQTLDVAGMLELKGTNDPRFPMTAAWSIVTDLAGNDVSAGLMFHDVHGRLTSKGDWDGVVARVDGDVAVDSLKVFENYELTNVRGPFRFRNGAISFGSLEALDGTVDRAISPDKQITARFVQGLLTINGVTSVDDIPEHHVRVNFSHGQLDTFAKLYLDKKDQMRGTMHGWLNLRGRGSDRRHLEGTGQLQISPAALYELPVVLQLVNVLTPQAANNAAFNYALANFRIDKGRYLFDAIDLVGESIQLRGTGEASFESDVNLTFYSMLPYSMLARNQLLPWVPVVSQVDALVRNVTREATKGWVVVSVTGKLDHPETKIVPAANFKGFLNTLAPLPSAPQPLRPAPPLARSRNTPLR